VSKSDELEELESLRADAKISAYSFSFLYTQRAYLYFLGGSESRIFGAGSGANYFLMVFCGIRSFVTVIYVRHVESSHLTSASKS
jgi:hypothetical protein